MKSRALENPITCLTEQVLANKLEELYILGNSRSGNLENSEQFRKPRNLEPGKLRNSESRKSQTLSAQKTRSKGSPTEPRKTHGTSKILSPRTQCAEKESKIWSPCTQCAEKE